jgi:hypothetical protein
MRGSEQADRGYRPYQIVGHHWAMECLHRVLVVSKRSGRRRFAAYQAPEPFNIIGERKPADC